jgi:hypothetical protein
MVLTKATTAAPGAGVGEGPRVIVGAVVGVLVSEGRAVGVAVAVDVGVAGSGAMALAVARAVAVGVGAGVSVGLGKGVRDGASGGVAVDSIKPTRWQA